MSEFLVVNAMGEDRTGIVSELMQVISEYGCNILDSQMALFGHEFTMSMMLSGSSRAITQLEQKLPLLSIQLGLLTMLKRTTDYDETKQMLVEVNYDGIDQPGILKAFTAFFAHRNIDISALKSNIDKHSKMMSGAMTLKLKDDQAFTSLDAEFLQLCQQLDVQGRITQINQTM